MPAKNKEVKLYMTPERQLYVRDKNGQRYNINLQPSFGGYIYLQTPEEEKELKKAREKAYKEEAVQSDAKDTQVNNSGFWNTLAKWFR